MVRVFEGDTLKDALSMITSEKKLEEFTKFVENPEGIVYAHGLHMRKSEMLSMMIGVKMGNVGPIVLFSEDVIDNFKYINGRYGGDEGFIVAVAVLTKLESTMKNMNTDLFDRLTKDIKLDKWQSVGRHKEAPKPTNDSMEVKYYYDRDALKFLKEWTRDKNVFTMVVSHISKNDDCMSVLANKPREGQVDSEYIVLVRTGGKPIDISMISCILIKGYNPKAIIEAVTKSDDIPAKLKFEFTEKFKQYI